MFMEIIWSESAGVQSAAGRDRAPSTSSPTRLPTAYTTLPFAPGLTLAHCVRVIIRRHVVEDCQS